MNVTSKISVDLTRQNVGQRVNAVQGDGNTRLVEITLLCGGAPWTPPDGVEAAIAYMQPSGTKGMYNLLADGTAAISITGNVATAILAPQMLTVSGTVQASLVFNDQRLNRRLTTFPFAVSVASNPAAGAQKVEDYIRLQWLEDKLDEYVKKITEGIVPGGAVSSVNGKTGAVVLTAGDVHALPDNTVIPAVPEKVSAFENDAGYLTEHQDISGKVDKVAGKGLSTHDYDNAAKAKVDAIPEDPKYTDTVYDDAEVKQGLNQLKDDLSAAVSQHNTDTTAHNDLRLALQGLSDRINAALDSDDTTLDQMSEVVAYIKSNKTLIDTITTSKVSVADIVNDLATNVTDKPLSAAQGVVLKRLIDELRTLIPEAYTLPVATETTLGGVQPVTATEAMTQPVGVTAEGRLVTKPGSGGGPGIAVTGATVGQTIQVSAVDDDGVPTAWEPVDFPGGESITAPVDIIASGTIPAGAKAWTNIGDIGVTWGDLRQYKSIGILFINGTDYLVLYIVGLDNWQRIQLSTSMNRFYTIFRFADTEKTKIQFDMCAGPEFWITNVDQVTLANKWSGNVAFNPSIVQTKFSDTEKISFVPNKDTTVDSTWYIIGITRN